MPKKQVVMLLSINKKELKIAIYAYPEKSIIDTLRAKAAQILNSFKTELLKALSKCHYTLKMLTNGHINCAYFAFAFRY